jgi:hypothetical protein
MSDEFWYWIVGIIIAAIVSYGVYWVFTTDFSK